jgi:hypothetical protein
VCCRQGDVAQLGEHLLCKQGVVGSNPIVSTIVLERLVRLVLVGWVIGYPAEDAMLR